VMLHHRNTLFKWGGPPGYYGGKGKKKYLGSAWGASRLQGLRKVKKGEAKKKKMRRSLIHLGRVLGLD